MIPSAADPVADRAADQCPDRDRRQKGEQVDLRVLDRDVEFADQIECVIGNPSMNRSALTAQCRAVARQPRFYARPGTASVALNSIAWSISSGVTNAVIVR